MNGTGARIAEPVRMRPTDAHGEWMRVDDHRVKPLAVEHGASDPEADAAVTLSQVTRVYRSRVPVSAVRDIDLTLRQGEMVGITGPSGSGKSTLLNLIGGLDVPTSGRVSILGTELSGLDEHGRSLVRRRHVAYVFQAYHLMPTLSCAENVALPLYLQGVPTAEIDQRVRETLDAVALTHRSRHLPDELSGGECQRVAIARALVTRPHLLLADEPTGNLDSCTGDAILLQLETLHRQRNTTLVLVTHDARAAQRCERIVQLRDGRITADSAP